MKPIQMVDLAAQYERIQEGINRAVLDVIRSGKYINGKSVDELMEQLILYTGAKYVIPCANGTDAIQIALMSLDLQSDDEIIIPAFNYVSAMETCLLLKLKPVLVDVNPRTFNIDVSKIETAISSKTKVIIPVHLFGQTADMEPLMNIAKEYGLYVIEDNAQSIGSVYTFSNRVKKQAGTIGDIGTLSFFPTKNLGCYGDGGAIMTSSKRLAQKLAVIALHGQSQKYKHEIIGCNSRLDTIQAAILKEKLHFLPSYIEARIKIATKYNAKLQSLTDLLEIPYCFTTSTHVYHQYTVKIKHNKRDSVQRYLRVKNIPTMVYYPLPLQYQPAFKKFVDIKNDLSETEKLCHSVLSLPMHTELDDEQLFYIVEQLTNYE